MDTLTGSVERITFYNPENGYTVLRLKPEGGEFAQTGGQGLATVTGNLPELAPGETLIMQGVWMRHPTHGPQFQVQTCKSAPPESVLGMKRYLGSGLVRGIGPRLADRIVSCFGIQTLEVIEHQPEKLMQVQDIGKKRAGMIACAWEEQKQIKEIMLFLHSYGISTNLAVKIFKNYGDESISIVSTDPYRLARDLSGVGFKTADRIARSLGLPVDHPSRIEAGVVFALNEACNEGHVFLPQIQLEKQAVDLLGTQPETIPPALNRLAESRTIIRERLPLEVLKTQHEGIVVYPSHLYQCETAVADMLIYLAAAFPTALSNIPPALMQMESELSEEQRLAVRTALSSPVSILTGGPGTGKTTALKALIEAVEAAGKKSLLASPTGRAAKRLSQAAGRSASTIHRLLGYSPGEGFRFNSDNPLRADLVIIDESSMLDLVLAHHFLKSICPGTHLLFVGDADQLPSVGPGNVLKEMIASEICPVTRLNVIFRQAAESHIITNAHKINRGETPIFPAAGSTEDFFLFPAETPESAAEWVEEVVCRRIPEKFGFHPRDDVQVLAPMYRGPAGVDALNERLQNRLNPPDQNKPEKTLFNRLFRSGDKVMQVANQYEKDVYNGDIGFLFSIDPIEHSLVVDFDGRAVTYDWNEADQLTLAYAISVHKAQGSEYTAVVLPLVTQHYLMLQRNLIYTAVTRARRLCVLVGQRKAIGIALNNNRVSQRFSALGWRLGSGI